MQPNLNAVLESICDIGIEMPGARGRRAEPLVWGPSYSLTAAHVVELMNTPQGAQRAQSTVSQLRTRHHKLAQLLASGMPEGEAAIQTGYSGSRISILKADPAFKELLSYYANNASALALEVQERMRLIATETLEELQQRLDEKPEEFTNPELIRLAEGMLDRTGHGKSATLKVEHGVSSSIMDELRRRHNLESESVVRSLEGRIAASPGTMIEGTLADEEDSQ